MWVSSVSYSPDGRSAAINVDTSVVKDGGSKNPERVLDASELCTAPLRLSNNLARMNNDNLSMNLSIRLLRNKERVTDGQIIVVEKASES